MSFVIPALALLVMLKVLGVLAWGWANIALWAALFLIFEGVFRLVSAGLKARKG
ncbi:hypothetical protein SAMN05421776_11729 [Nocardia farcinica]|uniref:Uncharacterized protein n=1 Tax=Nocardia farcinica TaxID=37329 RepID=A0A0H5PB56_NOCFR|nr:hypothetical protein [Nocardia farcinica]PFW99036.1 hypothetical protein CJ469_05636 [Nocardia farcinica]PFX06074.1 hypothetical protein CJ468_04934 [Nocardia farcinica]CRY79836.1 Uncharacterised protein [Nocardia farcinica]SIT33594.1 hypothetical protein SAMN05421776_11729 [Nocardia farcinica]